MNRQYIIQQIEQIYQDFGGQDSHRHTTTGHGCRKSYSYPIKDVSTLTYEASQKGLFNTEALLIVSTVAKNLSLGRVFARNGWGDDDKYYIASGIQPGRCDVLDDEKKEQAFTTENSNEIFAKMIWNTSNGKHALTFNVNVLEKLMPRQTYARKTKYYVMSYEPDMLFEIFCTVRKIRQNGSLAYYSTDFIGLEQLKKQLEGLLDDWIIVGIDRDLYENGRCETHRLSYGSEQVGGLRYISNVGSLSYK